MKKPTAKKPAPAPPFKGIVGEPTTVLLAAVKPNGWNFNVLTPFEFTSLRHGLKEDGWLASDALLVWGADNKGKAQDLIINGENRWKAAQELGMTTGPAVVLDGLTRAQAIALTFKLRNRRGSGLDDDLLSRALREVQGGLGPDFDLGLELGLPDEQLMRLLAEAPEVLPGAGADEGAGVQPNPGTVHSENAHVKMVPLYFSPEQYAAFDERIRTLSPLYELETVTDVVFEAVRVAFETRSTKAKPKKAS